MKKNSIAHFEIYADDPGKLKQFYSSLFDWTFDSVSVPGMDYTMVKTVDTDDQGMPTQPGGINGGMLKGPDGFRPGAFVSYVNVASVDESVDRAKQLGATVTVPKRAVPGMGWFSMLIDPQGNNFAVWQNDPNAQ